MGPMDVPLRTLMQIQSYVPCKLHTFLGVAILAICLLGKMY